MGMTKIEIPAGTRAVVIRFNEGANRVVFDMLNQPHGITLAQLTSNALKAMLDAGKEPKSWTYHFID